MIVLVQVLCNMYNASLCCGLILMKRKTIINHPHSSVSDFVFFAVTRFRRSVDAEHLSGTVSE